MRLLFRDGRHWSIRFNGLDWLKGKFDLEIVRQRTTVYKLIKLKHYPIKHQKEIVWPHMLIVLFSELGIWKFSHNINKYYFNRIHTAQTRPRWEFKDIIYQQVDVTRKRKLCLKLININGQANHVRKQEKQKLIRNQTMFLIMLMLPITGRIVG